MSNHVIPDDWKLKPLGQVANLIMGQSPSSDTYNSERIGLPFFQGKADFGAINPTVKTWCSQPTKIAPSDAILFSVRAPVGDVNITQTECCIGRGLASIQGKNVDQGYLYQQIQFVKPQFQLIAQGSTFEAVNGSEIKSFPILVPPLPEQQKIASILTSVDDVIEKIQSQINKLQDLKKGTMNELLTKGIGHTEFKDSPVGRIPKSWDALVVEDVIKFTGGAQPPRSTFVFSPQEGYIRLLQIRDYKSDRFATYIPEDLARRFCSEDDVMIGRYGPPIFQILRGKSGSYNVALIKAEPKNKKLLKGYMYHFLTRSDLFHMIESLSQRTSGQTGIDFDALKSFGFPLPPLNEQQRILDILDHQDSIISQKQRKLEQTKSLKKSLMQDLLTGKVRVALQ